MATATAPLILMDTHVHLHRCFAVEQVLAKGWANFAKVAAQRGQRDNFIGCLGLTEMAGEGWFNQQRQLAQGTGAVSLPDDWQLKSTADAVSLWATHPTGARLLLLAGRQIITQEKLEVLALLTPVALPDGDSLGGTVAAIAAQGGIPVLPWGVGKWIGPRGTLVTAFLQQQDRPKILLGDNSGRPWGWRRPPSFHLAEQQGLPVLPGTDPLPLPSEAARVGSFGLHWTGPLDSERPGQTIYAQLQALSPPISAYGPLEMPWRFVKNQVALRLQKAA
ncbi:MAG TPA: hypothetical protein V6D02_09480 [Candidatus Obscuribacterales bacterium]